MGSLRRLFSRRVLLLQHRFLPGLPFLLRSCVSSISHTGMGAVVGSRARGLAYHKWWSAVRKLLAAFGLSADCVEGVAPPELCVSSEEGVSPSTPSSYDEWRPAGQRVLTVAERDAWLAVNTAIYWHLLPSLDIDGARVLRQDDRLLVACSSRSVLYCSTVLGPLLMDAACCGASSIFFYASGPDLQRALACKLADCRMRADLRSFNARAIYLSLSHATARGPYGAMQWLGYS